MLGWAATFFVVALIAGVLGFTGIAVATSQIAQFLFFLVLFAVSLLIVLFRGRTPSAL